MGAVQCAVRKGGFGSGSRIPQMMVLYALETMGELTQKQVAENFGMQKQTVHTVVSALGKKGFLRLAPCTSDKREKRIILTESGREYSKKSSLNRCSKPRIGRAK